MTGWKILELPINASAGGCYPSTTHADAREPPISRPRPRGALSQQPAPAQRYELGVVRERVTAVHAAGGRIAAHVTTALVGALVALGIDSVEHGTSLDEPTLAEMAHRGTAWTPTLCALLASPPDATVERRRLATELHEHF